MITCSTSPPPSRDIIKYLMTCDLKTRISVELSRWGDKMTYKFKSTFHPHPFTHCDLTPHVAQHNTLPYVYVAFEPISIPIARNLAIHKARTRAQYSTLHVKLHDLLAGPALDLQQALRNAAIHWLRNCTPAH